MNQLNLDLALSSSQTSLFNYSCNSKPVSDQLPCQLLGRVLRQNGLKTACIPSSLRHLKLAQQPTNACFYPKRLPQRCLKHLSRTKVPECIRFKRGPSYFAQKAEFRDFFCRSATRTDPAPSDLPVTEPILTSQNLEPVTYQARKPRYLAEF